MTQPLAAARAAFRIRILMATVMMMVWVGGY
jgi:hypothetical protein